MLKSVIRVSGLLTCVLILAACNRLGGQSEEIALRVTAPATLPDGRSLLRRGNGAEPETLDPHKAQSTTSSGILRDLYEGLVSESADGALVPGVAERWEISEQGFVYTFYLRKDAKWSNGEPVTAEDFVYSLRRSVNPATGSSYSEILSPILNASDVITSKQAPEALGVEALDDHTLRIRLKAPTPYFIGLLAHASAYPVYRPAVEAHGDRFTQPGNAVSNGAYRITEWVALSHVQAERNPHYWDAANTRIDVVKFFAIDNAEAEFKRYLAGELDLTEGLPIPRIDWVKSRLPKEYKTHPSISTYYYGLNLEQPPFKNNPALRRALSIAIDRKVLTEKVTRGGEIPAYGWVPPGIIDYTPQKPEWADWPREQQLAEARRLYQQAGYSSEKPLVVELRYNTSEGHKKIAAAVAAMWKSALGVRVTLINEEWKVLLQNVNAKKITQVYRAGWVGDYNDAFTFAELMHSRFGLNGTGYASKQYDALVDAASVEVDAGKRREYLQAAERRLLQDQPLIPIYFYVSKRMVKPYVRGYQGNILNHHASKDMWIETGAKP